MRSKALEFARNVLRNVGARDRARGERQRPVAAQMTANAHQAAPRANASRHFTFRTSCAGFESVASTSTTSVRIYCRAGSTGCIREAVIVGRTKRRTKKEQQANEPDELLMERKVDCTGGIFAVQVSGVQFRLQASKMGDCAVTLLYFASFLGDRDRDSDHAATHLVAETRRRRHVRGAPSCAARSERRTKTRDARLLHFWNVLRSVLGVSYIFFKKIT